MLIPAGVVLILQKYVFKEELVRPFQISFKLNGWFLVALFTPVVLILLSFGINLLFPGVGVSLTGEGIIERFSSNLSAEQQSLMLEQLNAFPPWLMILISLASGLVAACTINALFAFGEELGWRGYMLYYLRNKSLWKASVIIGTVWGIWHFPLILMGHNYSNYPVVGVFMMIAFCILITPMMIYIVLKSKSVIAAAVFHGSINALAGLPLIYLVGGNELSNGLLGFAGFITIIVVTLFFVLYDKYVTKEQIFSNSIEKHLNKETNL